MLISSLYHIFALGRGKKARSCVQPVQLTIKKRKAVLKSSHIKLYPGYGTKEIFRINIRFHVQLRLLSMLFSLVWLVRQ